MPHGDLPSPPVLFPALPPHNAWFPSQIASSPCPGAGGTGVEGAVTDAAVARPLPPGGVAPHPCQQNPRPLVLCRSPRRRIHGLLSPCFPAESIRRLSLNTAQLPQEPLAAQTLSHRRSGSASGKVGEQCVTISVACLPPGSVGDRPKHWHHLT